MAGRSRKRSANGVVKDEKRPAKEVVVSEEEEEDPVKAEVAKLRGRWELASVLDCLIVFEPVIGKAVKISAEEIEMGLINPSDSLSQLHIALLKGIPPASKTLNGSDAWVTVLCKKLAPWWPWIAEGEIPLVAAKGEEISRYKELDPTNRLLLLKALCELRAEQDDALAYINDALKQGTEVSFFRKDKIGGDGKGTSYWYEGNTTIGHRLYKEVAIVEPKAKARGKGNLPNISFQFETMATNLEEFRKVVDELSSSKIVAKVSVAETIESDAIPALEKIQKKKERALKQKERQERQLDNLRNSYPLTTRSCRNRKPVSYTFDEYDRAIHEAIQVTKFSKRKGAEGKNHESKHRRRNGIDPETSDSGKKYDDSAGSDTASDMLQEVSGDGDDKNWGDGGADEDNSDHSDPGNSETDESNAESDDHDIVQKPKGMRWSSRLAGDSTHPGVENRNLGAKNRSRQRPIGNSAIESAVVPDSDDENSMEHDYSEKSGHENSPDIDPKEPS